MSAVPTEFEQAKERRAEQRRAVEGFLKPGQLKRFKREVRDVILSLVNDHGAQYRLQKDGQHIFLYSGKRGERPFKVAAARPVPAQMNYLVPWIREHYPNVDIESGKARPETVFGIHLFEPGDDGKCKVCGFVEDDGRAEHHLQEFRCTACGRLEDDCSRDPCDAVWRDRGEWPRPEDVEPCELAGQHVAAQRHTHHECPVTGEEEQEMSVAESLEPEQTEKVKITLVEQPVEEWVPYVYGSGKESTCFEFRIDPTTMEKHLRCIVEGCDYVREGAFGGVHLHEAGHSGEREEMLRKGVETKKALQEHRDAVLAEALDIMLKPHGYVAVKAEDAASLHEVQRLREENARLQHEFDELRAKFDLAREAFRL